MQSHLSIKGIYKMLFGVCALALAQFSAGEIRAEALDTDISLPAGYSIEQDA